MSMLTPVLQPPEVKEYLSKGERFIKWDDETANASPVILRVDPKGFYLYWTYQNKFLRCASKGFTENSSGGTPVPSTLKIIPASAMVQLEGDWLDVCNEMYAASANVYLMCSLCCN
ncbi:1-phosphatidylinositol -bisphosphate phosphodiesterase beta-2 isoform x1 [Limosa lapponica baueri]|uniref:1-phosphatidylinositol-bisphosphate phosphodiesterase beta-2 isoform x1 n=1 Tax=Limosa lapponica baueri TaxID=1758121 RepID=A0A2I0T7E7_LIMLA|nr:1-phosphatidylinositol -bisphosphate phosphodiesterase beta-2 isoform x1 [Limosa lapponica baueri]